jgi:hypothetical protein
MSKKYEEPDRLWVLLGGGATDVNVELAQRGDSCHLFWYYFDQDGMQRGTIARFRCADWEQAKERAYKKYENWDGPEEDGELYYEEDEDEDEDGEEAEDRV